MRCSVIVVFGVALGAAHGTVAINTRLLGIRGLPSACFHSRPPTPVINRRFASTVPWPPSPAACRDRCLDKCYLPSTANQQLLPLQVGNLLFTIPAAQITTNIHRLSLAAPAPHFCPIRVSALMFHQRAYHGRCCGRHHSRGRLNLESHPRPG